MLRRRSICPPAWILAAALGVSAGAAGAEEVPVPEVDGPWWTVAGDPDLGALTDPGQQPVDFAIWQAADGTWQLWSCIRKTRCGGNTRLFHRWQGKKLTDQDWEPMGIALQADPGAGETSGGLQAPFVLKVDGLYNLFYGDWEHICRGTSKDGKTFERWVRPDRVTGLFGEGRGANSRDPCVMRDGKLFYAYYTAHPGGQGSVYCRISADLESWSHSIKVAHGGQAGSGPYSAECPFVLRHGPSGGYYLFRTQAYGASARTSVYRSENPLDFGWNDDRCFLSTLPVAAPEIIRDGGEEYIASLLPSLKGIRLARLKWSSRAGAGAASPPGGGPVSPALPSEKAWKNSLGMAMARIEPGTFVMGTGPEEKLGGGKGPGSDFDERPAHKVMIKKPFFLGAHEVTNAQFEAFDPAHRALRGQQGFSRLDDEAVVFVSWHDAARFCAWLSEKEGRPYRLPTEAEWEYACRAGAATRFHTGDDLPAPCLKNPGTSWFPDPERSLKDQPVSLVAGATPPNAWGLHDLHGNVEEWCADWYGPYEAEDQVDPTGSREGDFRVTRGGSHSTLARYLRSANRMGTLPEDRSWLIGFRVAMGEAPAVAISSPPVPPDPVRVPVPGHGPDPSQPYFKGPRVYVKIPPDSQGPMFSHHNHDPAIVDCPNGDLLAIWYSCLTEDGRELTILSSRLRRWAEVWSPASVFWDVPDRNDHASALWRDAAGKIYHFNGLSAAATWGNLAVILRTSVDSGLTWSKARLILPEHGLRHQPVESVIRLRDGAMLLPCDAVTGGNGGTAIHLSRDGGATWTDPGGKIAGIHAGVVELGDGRLFALGRGDEIEGRMARSISRDQGRTWTSDASPFSPIGGGQRLALLRLREGPIVLASFAREMKIGDGAGTERTVNGLFTALSFDDGATWPARRLVTDGGPPRKVETTDGELFTLDPSHGEPKGYLSICQSQDGLVHLISSKQHYSFNLAWLKAVKS